MSRIFQKENGEMINGNSPLAAASKAFNSDCKSKRSCKKVVKVIDIATNKPYKYEVSRKVENKTVILGGTPVLFRFSTKVKSMNTEKKVKIIKNKKKKLSKCIKKCNRIYE